MTSKKTLHWTLTLWIIVLSACDARVPTTEEPRATDEPTQSVVSEVRPPTWTPTVPPDTPTPRPTATPVSPTPSPTRDPNLVLPDLQTVPPSDLVIQIAPDGRVLLRFTNSIMNAGPGTLELLGVLDPTIDKIAVTQHIDAIAGDIEERAAGEFIFHPDHDHWHLENFALYEVWSLTSDGDLDAVVAFTDKVSYCLRDNSRSDIDDAAPGPVYTACDQALQGISAGWIDTYDFDTPGQIVDISDVPDGMYALRSTVDPADQLWEADDKNNAATVYFELERNRVRILEGG